MPEMVGIGIYVEESFSTKNNNRKIKCIINLGRYVAGL